ncbi:MAG TPA: hypothetical protein VN848_10975 [Gemmatimonadales bacterium]|nr:hypothetical protein [Gemmatimonadales bacterium]
MTNTHLRARVVAALERHLEDTACVMHPDVPRRYAVARMLTGNAPEARRLYEQVELAKRAAPHTLERLAAVLKVEHAPYDDALREDARGNDARRGALLREATKELDKRVGVLMARDPKLRRVDAMRRALAGRYIGAATLYDILGAEG